MAKLTREEWVHVHMHNNIFKKVIYFLTNLDIHLFVHPVEKSFALAPVYIFMYI